jgi:hypothetical protein
VKYEPLGSKKATIKANQTYSIQVNLIEDDLEVPYASQKLSLINKLDAEDLGGKMKSDQK